MGVLWILVPLFVVVGVVVAVVGATRTHNRRGR
jgi:hypothetical protein